MTTNTRGVRSGRMRKPWKILIYARASRRFTNWPTYIVQTWRRPEHGFFRTRGGITYRVPFRLFHTFREVVVVDNYRMRRLVPELGPSPVLVDIGANAGFFSVQAAELIPGAQVHAFEPLPGNYKALTENLALNPELARRVHAHHRAVSGPPVDSIDIYTQVGKSETGLASRHADWTKGEKDKVTIPAVTLASIAESLAPRDIDLLKVDCEGSEYDILFGTDPAVLQRIRRIVMEVHSQPFLKSTRHDMVAFLCDQGYTVEESVGRKGRTALVWARRG